MGLEFVDIYPLHAARAKDYRRALYPSGAKSDPVDAQIHGEFYLKHPERFTLFIKTKAVDLSNRSLRFDFGDGLRFRRRAARQERLELIRKEGAFTEDEATLAVYSRKVQTLAGLLLALHPQIEAYEKRIKELFRTHPDAPVFSGFVCRIILPGPAGN